MTTKTARNDARGMSHLLRMGWYRPVHLKSMDAREQRALLSARRTLMRRLRDIENSVRGLLRGFGFRFSRILRRRWGRIGPRSSRPQPCAARYRRSVAGG